MVLSVVRDLLEEDGYRVLTASGPAEAAQLAASYPDEIQLLLTDVVMPGGNGLDLARALVKDRPTMKVLLMSGFAANVDPGAMPLIAKPFAMDELGRRIAALLGVSGTQAR